MADISDITAYLAQAVTLAVYPNGTSSPSVAAVPFRTDPAAEVHVFEGWPQEERLDPDLAAGNVQVSIYPMRGGAPTTVGQYLAQQETLVAPVHGLSISIADDAVTLSGTPTTGEYLTINVDRMFAYTSAASTGAAMLTALRSAMLADYPGATAVGNVLTIPGSHLVEAKSGAAGLAGIVTHRQKQPVMVTVWAPNPTLRTVVAKAIDVAIKATLRVTLQDYSQAILRVTATNVSDERVNNGIFRRDLIVEAEYATLDTYTVYEITHVGATLDVGPSFIGHVQNVAISAEG